MTIAVTGQPRYVQISDGKNGKPVYFWSGQESVVGNATGGTMGIGMFEGRRDKYQGLVYNVEHYASYSQDYGVGIPAPFCHVSQNYYTVGTLHTRKWSVQAPQDALGGNAFTKQAEESLRHIPLMCAPDELTGVSLLEIYWPNKNAVTVYLTVCGFAWLKSEFLRGAELRPSIR